MAKEPSFPRARLGHLGIGAGFAFPVLTGDQVAAVLEFFCEREVETDEAFLEAIADVGAQLGRVVERAQAEEALRESEERLQLISRAMNDVLWEWDVAVGSLTWNDIASKAFRYRPDEIGSSIDWWYERIHPEDRERVVGGLDAIVTGTGEMWSSEYRFLRGDGSYATIFDRGCVVRTDRGIMVRMISSMLDVSERRRGEEAQRLLGQASGLVASSLDSDLALTSFSRSIIPSVGDYCFIDLLEDGRLHRTGVAHTVPGKEALLGQDEPHALESEPAGSLIAKALNTRKPVLITKCTSSFMKKNARDAEDRRRVQRLGTRSLMVLPLVAHDHVLGALIIGSSESGRHFGPADLLFAEELSRRCAVALENSRLYEQAQNAVRAREEILGVVSHDLRNPLHTIQLATDLLREGGQKRTSGNQKWFGVIQRCVEQMQRMIEDLLDQSSIDTGHLAIARVDHDVAALMAAVFEIYEPLGAQSSVVLECEVGPDVSTAWIDPDRIHRVFSNLIGNALKFTPAGQRIVMRAERRAESVCFSVTDTGPGIPEDELPRVFDRYWQARGGDRRGAGLGLAIARGIVEAHGGQIWAHSTPGEGAAFFFTVPITEGC